ncbi:MAG: extensin family protein [Myxococcales bacterium]|nr:extensin family protein [Myxococcales bacterium]
MRRGPLLALLVAGAVVASSAPSTPSAEASAARRKASSGERQAAKGSGKASSTRTRATARAKRVASERRKQRRKKKRELSRVPNRRTATNMPRGWRWPPSRSMRTAGERCTEALEQAKVPWERSAREGKIVTPLVVSADGASSRELTLGGIVYHSKYRKPPFTMDCHLALALATHGPALQELGVRKVVFGSIFRFTKVRAHGKTKNVLSRHALGLAMDVVSFEDEAGVVHDVLRDYPAGDELLRSVEDALNGSGGFRTVLTPRNDPTSHHDHFHIEADISYYEDERNLAALPRAAAGEADEEHEENAEHEVGAGQATDKSAPAETGLEHGSSR